MLLDVRRGNGWILDVMVIQIDLWVIVRFLTLLCFGLGHCFVALVG